MQSRKLGPFQVSSIGLGCMNLSQGYGVPVSAQQGERLLLSALDAGVTLFDTAALYGFGANESLLGQVLKGHRQRLTLASKCGLLGVDKHGDGKMVRVIDGRPKTLQETCEASLRRLQTDVIDLYYLHRLDKSVPIEEKKTFAWIEGLRMCVELDKRLPDTRQICVMDREADFFELFDEQRKTGKVDLLVRSNHDRVVKDDDKAVHLFKSVRQSPICGEMVIQVQRQSTRTKKSKQQAKPGHVQRSATVVLRYKEIELRPGAYQKDKAPIKLTVVHVQETTQPKDDEPVEWFLLTTCDVSSPEQAQQILRWYCLRWRIEDWHRVLKSGCNIEKLQHKTAERLKRTIAINLVIAWRIMLLTLLGRECPQLAAEVLFSDLEIQVLIASSKKTEPTPPAGASRT